MQDQQVAFDPISIRILLPWQTRVFVLYLFIACVIWLVRSIQLVWQLRIFPVSLRKLQPPSNKDDQSEFLASSALAKKFPEFISSRSPETAYLLQNTGNKFSFMWDECWSRVSSLHRLTGLTFLSSILLFAWNAANVFAEISYSKASGIVFLSGSFSELFTQLKLGMEICVLLYITSSFFERALLRRKAIWSYICGKSKLEMNRE